MTWIGAAVAGGLYGLSHGLGADHCAALATLVVRGADRRRAIRLCVRFGVGHALVIGSLAALATLSGWLIPASWENAFEAVGGALLVFLGGVLVARSLPLVLHRHGHDHEGSHHEHWHLHAGDAAKHEHGHAGMLGGLFALSGVRAVAVCLAPLLIAGRSTAGAVAYLVCFGAGVTASMIGFATLLAMGRAKLGGRALEYADTAVGAGTCVLGAFWVISSLT